jgi:UDP-4-amino-4-deoxy-L-arabinose formyltransferase/UDP-glucuronic acid dehydrogenase (UDP-4-keto-hexauronic acid decarboxylating)
MNIYILCTLNSGADFVNLITQKLPIKGIIGLGEREGDDSISGYLYMKPMAMALGMEFISIDSYGFTTAADRKRIEELDIDLLLVCAWQRLVPEWLITKSYFGVIGYHGSAGGISLGRGRSPQNWALISGAKSFFLSMFFIDAGIDSGHVISTREFFYSKEDDIVSSQFKAMLTSVDMTIDAYEKGLFLTREANAQENSASYLPMRAPEDGAIDWRRSSEKISHFVRALTNPYPCAYCDIPEGRLKIIQCRSIKIESSFIMGIPGRILLLQADGGIVVETGDGLLLVDAFEWMGLSELADHIASGYVLPSANYLDQIVKIIERHKIRYPELPISPLISGELEIAIGTSAA